ncbi:MAG: hypothetical protein ABJM39_11715 [Porticoccus sp.]
MNDVVFNLCMLFGAVGLLMHLRWLKKWYEIYRLLAPYEQWLTDNGCKDEVYAGPFEWVWNHAMSITYGAFWLMLLGLLSDSNRNPDAVRVMFVFVGLTPGLAIPIITTRFWNIHSACKSRAARLSRGAATS